VNIFCLYFQDHENYVKMRRGIFANDNYYDARTKTKLWIDFKIFQKTNEHEISMFL